MKNVPIFVDFVVGRVNARRVGYFVTTPCIDGHAPPRAGNEFEVDVIFTAVEVRTHFTLTVFHFTMGAIYQALKNKNLQ